MFKIFPNPNFPAANRNTTLTLKYTEFKFGTILYKLSLVYPF
jgi:hypothetical protein